MTKSQTDLVDLVKRFDTLGGRTPGFIKRQTADAGPAIGAAKSAARSTIKARLDLEKLLDGHKINYDEAEDDRSLKVKVLNKIRPELKLTEKSDEYIESAFDLALAYDQDKNNKFTGQIRRLDTIKQDEGSTSISSHEARERMLARIRGEKQEMYNVLQLMAPAVGMKADSMDDIDTFCWWQLMLAAVTRCGWCAVKNEDCKYAWC